MRYPSAERGIHALDDVRVATKDGMVPISTFVQVQPAPQVNSIERINAHRVYHVRGNVKPGVNVNAEAQKIKDWVATQNLPRDVRVTFKGSDQDQQEAGVFLIKAGFMALFLIAVVLLAMFNSFYHASLILLAVILAMIGALLGMVIIGQSFSRCVFFAWTKSSMAMSSNGSPSSPVIVVRLAQRTSKSGRSRNRVITSTRSPSASPP